MRLRVKCFVLPKLLKKCADIFVLWSKALKCGRYVVDFPNIQSIQLSKISFCLSLVNFLSATWVSKDAVSSERTSRSNTPEHCLCCTYGAATFFDIKKNRAWLELRKCEWRGGGQKLKWLQIGRVLHRIPPSFSA